MMQKSSIEFLDGFKPFGLDLFKADMMPIPLQILLVEDRASDADLMLDELQVAGFTPEWERVETESDYLAHLSPALDLILADYSLPQFDGIRALHLLRERGLD